PLSSRMVGLLCVCIVLCGLAAWKLKPVHVGDYLKLSVNAKEAKVQAEEILKQQSVDAKSYVTATIFVDVTDATANEYLREKIGVPALNAIYEKRRPGALWRARFCRTGQAEEHRA